MRKMLIILLFVSTIFAQDKLSLQLLWLNQFQFAGFYIAKNMGFYSELGLDVEIREYKKALDVVDEIVSQKADFGIGRSSLLIDRANGKNIIGLVAIYQSSPSILISLDEDIKQVKDLKDKRIMITPNSISSAGIASMLFSQGLSPNDIIRQKHSFNLQDLIDKKTDAMSCYISNEPFELEQKGIKYKIFNPKDYGFDFYGDILFTSEKLLKTNPAVVRKFYEASMKGWRYAFEHIEETAKLIEKEYNSQHKSLESLIYEGRKLRELAYEGNTNFGSFDKEKLKGIVNIYKISGLLKRNLNVEEFLDNSGVTKEMVKIGILAKRGEEIALQRWNELGVYLNEELPSYSFEIVPLKFEQLENAIKDKQVDFVVLNTMNYIQFEQMYGISRIATLKNASINSHESLTKFGSVIFTKATNKDINELKDVKDKNFGAVSELSFGGWVMAKKELRDQGIREKDIKLSFYDSHDDVVKAVLNGDVDIGSVRTDTIEKMVQDGLLKIDSIRVINQKHYPDFPYLVSTDLYPEWPFSKLNHAPDSIANDVLSKLLALHPNSKVAQDARINGWTIPLDYSKVFRVLKELKIYPFDKEEISLKDIYTTYEITVNLIILFIIFMIMAFSYAQYMKQKLNQQVKQRTRELLAVNKKLKELATTDELTGISNRRDFLGKMKKLMAISRRNATPLAILSLDIDHFKKVNDTYGHAVGDEILKLFCKVVNENLRESDIFGRLGGEEFSIVLQNTDVKGALVMAQKLRKKVEEARYKQNEDKAIQVTVSIGVTILEDDDRSEDSAMKRADIALYKAKDSGRNKVELF